MTEKYFDPKNGSREPTLTGNPLFSLILTFETYPRTQQKTGQIQNREHFEILGSKHSFTIAMHHLAFY